MNFSNGKKLREVVYGYDSPTPPHPNTGLKGLISFAGTTQLEKLYLSGID
jgi:hypothetical protein